MKTVSMLEFRHHADKIIAQVQRGERMILTYRGKAVARLEPVAPEAVAPDDPFYSLTELSVPGESLSNDQIDDIVYGQ